MLPCHHDIQPAGFWRRLLAFLLDSLMIGFVTMLLALTLFGHQYSMQMQEITLQSTQWSLHLLEQGLPVVWTIGFWLLWMATPGKMLMDIEIVDAKTGTKAGFGQLVLRYLGYIVSGLPLGLGFLWIVIDKRKQGWHDKLSSTRVIMQDASLLPLESYHD
jgi:uncharacterized RDD family membrane protein YckC